MQPVLLLADGVARLTKHSCSAQDQPSIVPVASKILGPVPTPPRALSPCCLSAVSALPPWPPYPPVPQLLHMLFPLPGKLSSRTHLADPMCPGSLSFPVIFSEHQVFPSAHCLRVSAHLPLIPCPLCTAWISIITLGYAFQGVIPCVSSTFHQTGCDEVGTESSTPHPGLGPGPGPLDSGCMSREVDACRRTQKMTQTHPQAMPKNCHIDKHPGKFIDMGLQTQVQRDKRDGDTYLSPVSPMHLISWWAPQPPGSWAPPTLPLRWDPLSVGTSWILLLPWPWL